MHIFGIGSGFRNIANAVERAAFVKLTYRNYVLAAMQRAGGGGCRQDVALFAAATAFFLVLAAANRWVRAAMF